MNTSPTPRRPVRDLTDLVAWQLAMDFAEAVYRTTRVFPSDERLGLRLQLRRSAVSVASNIAEGHGRLNRKEYRRFVLIARGSLKEAETQVRIAKRLGFFGSEQTDALLAMTNHINRLLTGLKNSLST